MVPPPTVLPPHFCRPSLAWLSLAHPHYSSALERAQVISGDQSLSQAAQHLAVSLWTWEKWMLIPSQTMVFCFRRVVSRRWGRTQHHAHGSGYWARPTQQLWKVGVTVLFVGVTQSTWTQLHLRTVLERLLTWIPFSMALRIRGKR